MSEMVTVEDVDCGAFRALEGIVFLPLVLVALAGLGILAAAGTLGTTLGGVGLVLGGSAYLGFLALAVLAHLVIPVLLFVDARRVRAADCGWEPSPTLYAVGGLFLSYLVAAEYLWKRHKVVVDRVDSESWWPLVVVGAFGPLAGVGLFVALRSSVETSLVALLPLAVAAIFAGLFPIAAYKDATYVRLRSGDWQPNPGNYIATGLFLWILSPILYPLAGCYYVLKRQRALG